MKLNDLSSVLNKIPEMIILHDSKGNVEYANRRLLKAYGLSVEDIDGAKCTRIVCDSDDWCDNCPVLKTLKTKKAESGEIRTPNGRTLHVRSVPLLDDDGELRYVLEIIKGEEDEEPRVKDVLDIGEAMYTVFDAIKDSIVIVGRDNKILALNRQAADMLGEKADHFIGMMYSDLFPKETSETMSLKLSKAFSGNEASQHTYNANGRALESHIIPLKNAQGAVERALVYTRDMAENVLLKEKMNDEGQTMDKFIDRMNDEVFAPLKTISSYMDDLECRIGGCKDEEALRENIIMIKESISKLSMIGQKILSDMKNGE